MKLQNDCQLQRLQEAAQEKADDYHPPFSKRIRNAISRQFSPKFKRQLKMLLFEPKRWMQKYILRQKTGKTSIQETFVETLRSGDKVRIRQKEEIMATLDRWGQLNGCSFLAEMSQYCGTIQEVFKPVERFVDERDRSVRRAKGIVLLKDIYCQGTQTFGACDRSCLYFWRVEWLERIRE